MITPKASFQRDDRNKPWQDVVDNPLFHRAAEAALAQMTINTPPSVDLQAATHFRIQGAKDFLSVLMSLSLKPEPTKSSLYPNLKQT